MFQCSKRFWKWEKDITRNYNVAIRIAFIDRIRSHKQSRHYMYIRYEINNIVFEWQGNYLGNDGVLKTY